MTIKSFRGRIADNGIQTIPLSTNNGSIGYRIVKFSIMPGTPPSTSYENVVKIFTIPQTTANATMDFSDNTLLAAAFMSGNSSTNYAEDMHVVFDNMTFNQDIFVTYTNNVAAGSDECNYYIELETSNLSLDENTVATLKDIRNITQ